MKNTRRCQTIFCDDIREEVRGKVSLIGVYNDSLLYKDEGTLVLPKFCIFNRVYTPSDAPLQALNISIFKNEERINKLEMPIPSEPPSDNDDLTYAANIIMSPMEISEPFLLRVVAETESEEIFGGQLKFGPMPT